MTPSVWGLSKLPIDSAAGKQKPSPASRVSCVCRQGTSSGATPGTRYGAVTAPSPSAEERERARRACLPRSPPHSQRLEPTSLMGQLLEQHSAFTTQGSPFSVQSGRIQHPPVPVNAETPSSNTASVR